MGRVLVIAEAGVNHNADMDIARKLVDAAVDAAADFVKFQTAVPELLVSAQAKRAEYQVKNTGVQDETQLDMVRKLCLPLEAYRDLQSYAEKKGIAFLSTAFDMVSLELLNDMGLPLFKVPSGEITNLPYLRRIGSFGKDVIISTGMATLDEIGKALTILQESGLSRDKIVVMHCTTDYPTRMSDVNLKAMLTIADAYGVRVGYSDHTMGIEVPIAAVALGACVVEKHFTLSRNMEGPDHKASLEPGELRDMVRSIRHIEAALGDGIKKPTATEIKNIPIVRRSVHLKDDVCAGEILTEDKLIMKRPGDGVSPMDIDKIIGRPVKAALPQDHKISLSDIL